MRKYIIGALAGAALMMSVQAGASGLLTGSKVAGSKDVKYNGKTIGQAAIINNSSYLPVRAVSDAMGLQIDLSGGTINLSSDQQATTGTQATPEQSPQTQPTLTADEISRRIAEIDKSIKNSQDTIENVQKMIDALIAQKNTDDLNVWQRALDEAKDSLPKLQQQRADLEAQLKTLQGQ